MACVDFDLMIYVGGFCSVDLSFNLDKLITDLLCFSGSL